ncbi:WD repeat-containing protein 92 [Blattella germanica]|nr:WD repeat-containing protein 92 [Blattella germanica]
MDKPQIICHVEKSLGFSLFECRWIPCSAKFIVLGSKPRGTGVIHVYEISEGDVKLVKESTSMSDSGSSNSVSDDFSILWKACFFVFMAVFTNAFDLVCPSLTHVSSRNLEDTASPVYSANGHKEIINCIDGVGGLSIGCGAPEIVTGGRDGNIQIYYIVLLKFGIPDRKENLWQSWNHLRGLKQETVGQLHLVCSLEFDRKDIPMNKLVATTLESKFYVFDVRTQHSKKGFTYLTEKVMVMFKEAHKATIWVARHLPQNRDVFATCGGAGSLCLWQYNYPSKRVTNDGDGESIGVIGSLNLLQNITLATQPISSFDWSPDKEGLAVCSSFDQTLRVIITTKLNTL